FTYRASDASLSSNLATVAISVAAVNDAPVAANDTYSVNEDTTLTVAAGTGLLANDTDIEGDALTAAVATGPAHGTLTLSPNGSFTYTPAANFNGSDSFTYRASDAALTSNLATVTISVAAVNDAPVAVNESYSVNGDVTLTVAAGAGVLGNDTDIDGDTLTAAVATGPAHRTLTFNPNGSFTYTPTANFNGSDSFTYRASDAALTSNLGTVTISVDAAAGDGLPVAANDN